MSEPFAVNVNVRETPEFKEFVETVAREFKVAIEQIHVGLQRKIEAQRKEIVRLEKADQVAKLLPEIRETLSCAIASLLHPERGHGQDAALRCSQMITTIHQTANARAGVQDGATGASDAGGSPTADAPIKAATPQPSQDLGVFERAGAAGFRLGVAGKLESAETVVGSGNWSHIAAWCRGWRKAEAEHNAKLQSETAAPDLQSSEIDQMRDFGKRAFANGELLSWLTYSQPSSFSFKQVGAWRAGWLEANHEHWRKHGNEGAK